MHPRRRLTRQGRRRKAQLIHHGALLFAERGYAETRVLDIVRAAGVAKGLFYWYFENKEDLFKELIDDTRRQLRQAQAEAIRGVDDPLERLYRATAASVRFMARHHHVYALMREASASGDSRAPAGDADGPSGRLVAAVRRTSDIHTAEVTALLAQGQERGVVRADDARLLAYGVLGTTWATVHFGCRQEPPVPVEELASATARSVVRAVAVDHHLARAAELRAELAAGAQAGQPATGP